jgi:signal transduction histidine kinase/ActR/RegA family two-component response regulator
MDRHWKDLLAVVLLTLLYFCAGKLGLSVAFLHRSATAVWPPTGLALAAVLLLGYRVWPAIFIGAFLVNWSIPQPALPSLMIAVGNTLEAVIGAALARRCAGGANAFGETGNIFRFVFLAALPSTALSATIGIAALASGHLLGGGSVFAVWLTWWMGDFVSDLLVAPLLLLWLIPPRPRFDLRRFLEGLVMLLAVLVFSRILFSGGLLEGTRDYPLEYLGIPLLLWAAFRFHQRGAITASVVMSAAAVWGTLKGHGPFAVGNRNDALLLLQSFMGVTTLTMVVLAAVIADRQHAQERERAARAEAERANSAKDQFLAVLSHELRTPLTPVMLAASMLENDRALPKQVREDLQTIRRNVELEARLIDDLLDLTRISRGKMPLDLHVVDIHELIQRAIDICCRDRRTQLNVKLEAKQHHVRADPARIQQVFWNLLNNAMKFTPEGGTVSVRSKNLGQDIVVEVVDTGAGIESEFLPKLFSAFAQGDRDTAQRGAGGLGLGLAISKALITAHGGTVTATSGGRGQGSTFTVQMPAVFCPPESLPRESDRAGVKDHASQGQRILLVEDHDSTLVMLTKLLSVMGHRVTPVNSIAAALRAFEGNSFDLLISDLGLPDGLGYDLMKRVKSQYGIRGIVLSGYGMDSDVQRSKEAGFFEHLTKPIDMDTLEAAIARATAQPATAQ